MTEAEWLACTNPKLMLEYLGSTASERKLRLFAVACCRHLGQCPHVAVRAVDVAEQYADRRAGKRMLASVGEELNAVDTLDSPHTAALRAAVYASIIRPKKPHPVSDWVGAAGWAAEAAGDAFMHRTNTGPRSPHVEGVRAAERSAQCSILKCIFGNPFRPVALDPAWVTPAVTALAATIYEDRAFDRMPILADALEEAGCDDADILSHCRGPGPHVRGCWVVDLLTGRE
jgi:hypothetical protein